MPTSVTIEPENLRSVLRRLVTGVTVITTINDGRPWGMTVSAFTAVALEPPLVLVCVNRATATAAHITEQRRLGINVLAAGQSELSGRCSAPGTPKFLDDADLAEPLDGWVTPRIAGALAAFDTEVEGLHDAGTHVVVIARIRHVSAANEGGPLLYGAGRYIDLAGLA
jgi:flavin reductase (DIM6/NTAB) family NADH-FMN oxidoreductase RutF